MSEPSNWELSPGLAAKGYSLRLASLSDHETVAALMRDYFAELGLEYDPQNLDHDLADPAAAYEGGGLILLLNGRSAAGCVGVRSLAQGEAELKRMYLDPGHRGRGLGRALLHAALGLARERGYQRILLDTRLELISANRLYESCGFHDTHDYSKNPRAQRFMVLDLQACQ